LTSRVLNEYILTEADSSCYYLLATVNSVAVSALLQYRSKSIWKIQQPK